MRSRLAVLLAVLASPAAAQLPGADSGLLVSFRAGYGVPFGEVARDGAPVGDLVRAKLPLALDLGYRFGGRVQGALYVELAPAAIEVSCPPGVSCSASDVRLGLAVQLHAAPSSRVDPWIAVGFGIEVMNAAYVPAAGAGRWEYAWSGVELPVEAGVDLRLADRFTLGPFVHASFAQFTSFTQRPPGGTTVSGSIDDRETHGWLGLGLKATLWL